MSRERRDYSGNHEERKEQTAHLVSSGFEGLVKELEGGKSERFLQYLAFCAHFHQYSPYNQMLIWLQKPDATRVAGFQTWKQLGYPVRKGEKGIAILAPLITKTKDTENPDKETSTLIGFKVVYVFDESQVVEDKPLPTLIERLPDDQQDLFDTLCQLIVSTGITVELQRLAPGVHGVSQGGSIAISSEWDSRNRLNVLLHEWAHELLHREWISTEERQQLPRRVKECQAEATAYIVAQYLGLQNIFSRDYLHLYDVTPQLLIDNLDQVQRASHHMIETIESGYTTEEDIDFSSADNF